MPNSKQNPLLNYRTLTDEERFLNQQNKINAKYDSQINNLNLGKTTQQQQADITRSQLQKYLPYYYKSKGLSGLGLEQSAMLDANANYTNQLGQIENNFTQQKNALENYRQGDLMKAESDYLDRIDTNSMSAYNEVTNPLEMYIADEKLTDDEYKKVIDTLKLYEDIMTPTDKKMAEKLLENYKTQFGKAGAESPESFKLTEDMKLGNETFKINGETYKINDYFPVANNKLKYNLNKLEEELGFELNGMNDSQIPNGTIVGYTTGSAASGSLRVKQAMFLNGKWYEVEKAN
jgi:hypothetical protein